MSYKNTYAGMIFGKILRCIHIAAWTSGFLGPVIKLYFNHIMKGHWRGFGLYFDTLGLKRSLNIPNLLRR